MALIKYKLGDLIQESFRKNDALSFDISFVRGISNNKEIEENAYWTYTDIIEELNKKIDYLKKSRI